MLNSMDESGNPVFETVMNMQNVSTTEDMTKLYYTDDTTELDPELVEYTDKIIASVDREYVS